MRILFTIILLPFLSTSVVAQAVQDLRDCQSSDPDRAIRGCSFIIISSDKDRYQHKNLASVYFSRARAYERKRFYNQAILDYTQAIRFSPDTVGAYVNRGGIYARRGQRDRAIADWRKALELRPSLRIARENLKRIGAKPGPPSRPGPGSPDAATDALKEMPSLEGLKKF
jgi:tetratricopeptide (TPR) repeat protein